MGSAVVMASRVPRGPPGLTIENGDSVRPFSGLHGSTAPKRYDQRPCGGSTSRLIIIGVVLVFFGLLVFLGRFRNGALLRPVIAWLSRIGFMRRFFTSVSTKAIERQNPELASAIKKINPVASNPNPQAVQKAMSRLTPAERRAYMEAAQEQGGVPDTANRQMRRQAERMQQQARGGRPGGGGASSSRKRKRK